PVSLNSWMEMSTSVSAPLKPTPNRPCSTSSARYIGRPSFMSGPISATYCSTLCTRMRFTRGPSGEAKVAYSYHAFCPPPLLVCAGAARPALAGSASRSVPGVAERGDAPADPRRRRGPVLPAFPAKVPDARVAFAGRRGRGARAVERARLLRAGTQSASGGARRGGGRRPAADGGGAARAARLRSLHGGGRGEPRLQRAGAARGR